LRPPERRLVEGAGTNTGLSGPCGLALDSTGAIYVTNPPAMRRIDTFHFVRRSSLAPIPARQPHATLLA
jgi:hypothetical protein